MGLSLPQTFAGLAEVPAADADKVVYSVATLADHPGSYVGRDALGQACILISPGTGSRSHPPVRLENIEAQFDVRAVIRAAGVTTEGHFTIIRCRSTDRSLIDYFLSVGETVLKLLGPQPDATTVARAVNRLALIFQRLQRAPTRSASGLFAELFLIAKCRDPERAVSAWRLRDTSRFDFSAGDLRLEVKAASGRARSHVFSYEQCSPPAGTVAVVASLLVEQSPAGASLSDMVRLIEAELHDEELALKLHEVVAETLGASLSQSLALRFDDRLAASSLAFLDLREIPAIRGELPPGVSDVHFRADLSAKAPISLPHWVDKEPALADFLPRD